MSNITTEAWVIYRGTTNGSPGVIPAELRKEQFSFPGITENEMLVEPIYGCWEGNMTHAVERQPIDICEQRGEEKVVIGNAGVVRVLKTGSGVKSVKAGQYCLVFCNGVWDELGYPKKILGYDARGSIGVLARRMKLHERQLIPIPKQTKYTLQQWAAFSLRYVTAWANWKLAYGCYTLQFSERDRPPTFVWAWGGGVALAESQLARLAGCEVAMISSNDERLRLIKKSGIKAIDRRQFSNLDFNQERCRRDPERTAYQTAEETFLSIVKEHTRGQGVSIFIDFIGLPVYRATLKALARPGIITTAGWKLGMNLSSIRAIECMNWHTHVHTHYARYPEGLEAVCFAEEHGWMPPASEQVFAWDEIPALARKHADGALSTYFPIFQINPA
jgi:NADPH:quinone reductase-like Zn-dependent oxidoreductase